MLAPKVDHLRATDQFKMAYEPFGAMFAMVPLAELVTPQWWADAEYVEALAASAPAEDDLDGMFDFSFSMGRLARPMNLELNGAARRSRARAYFGEHLIRRDLQAHPLPVHMSVDLVGCCSAMRDK